MISVGRTGAIGSIGLLTKRAISGIAAVIEWLSTAATTAWGTDTNWQGGIAPPDDLITSVARFNSASYVSQPNAGTRSVKGINVGASSAALTISGTALTVGLGDVIIESANAVTITPAMSGVMDLVDNGSGVLTLSGANTFTGATQLNAGSTVCGATNTLSPNSAVTLANTAGVSLDLNGFNQTVPSIAGGGTTGGSVSLGANTLTVNGSATTTLSGVVSGTGGNITLAGTTALTLAGVNTLTGTIIVPSGCTLKQSGTTGLGTALIDLRDGATFGKVSGGLTNANNNAMTCAGFITLDASSSNTYTFGTGVITVTGDTTFNVITGNFTNTGNMAESGGAWNITKLGSQALSIGGTSARTGNWVVNDGILACSTSGGFGNGTLFLGDTTGSLSAQIQFGAGTTTRPLTVRAGSTGLKTITRTSGANPTLSGVITLNDTLYLNPAGTTTLSGTITGVGGLRIITSNSQVNLSATTKSGWTGGLFLDSGGSVVILTGGATGASATAAITTAAGYTGTLRVNSPFTGTGACVHNGGTINGTSTIGGSMTVGPGATLAGGQFSVAGNITLGAVTFQTGAILGVNIASTTSVNRVISTGAVVFNGNTVNFQPTALNAGTYTILTCVGTPTGTLVIGTLPTGRTFSSFAYLVGSVTVTFT